MARSKSGLLGLQSDLMDHFTLNEQNNLEQGHYTVVDASISWHPTKQYELSIYAKNIGDALYIERMHLVIKSTAR